MTLNIQEVPLKTVIDQFAKGFQPPEGKTIHHYETFIDQVKGVVFFKLHIQEDVSNGNNLITLPEKSIVT